MLDLLSKLNNFSENKQLKPREIFMSLPQKDINYGYPRDVQSDVWEKWFDVRTQKIRLLK